MAKKKRPHRPDPLDEWREIQDHQYDPGYWVGGRIHPIIRASHTGGRPTNKYGWVLLPSGLIAIAFGAGGLRDGGGAIVDAVWPLLLGLVMTAAGFRLLLARKAKPKD